MKKTGSVILSVITALSMMTSALPNTVSAAGESDIGVIEHISILDNIELSSESAEFGTLSTENGKYADERIVVTMKNNNNETLTFKKAQNITELSHFAVLGIGENEKVALKKGESFSFTVKPNEGLKAGTYDDVFGLGFEGDKSYSTYKFHIRMTLKNESKYVKEVSDPVQFDLNEGYEVAESAKQISLKNISSGNLRYVGCELSTDKFTVKSITSSGGSLASGNNATFRIVPVDGIKYSPDNHMERAVFTFADADGVSHTRIVDFGWRINAEFAGDITVSPYTADFGTLTEGYSVPTARTIIISNAEPSLTVTASRPEARYFNVGELVCGTDKYIDRIEVVNNKSVAFSVVPKAGLKAGVYEERLEVKLTDESGKNVSVKTITARYTVTEKEKSTHTVKLSASSGGNAGIVLDNDGDISAVSGTAIVMPTSFTAAEGEKVTILGSPSDKNVFKKWEVTSGGVKLDYPNSGLTSFVMGNKDVDLTAVFEEVPEGSHSIRVESTQGGSAWAEPAVAKKGDEVDIHGRADEGYHFVKYEIYIDGKKNQDVEGSEIDFELPDKDLEVKAIFETDPYTAAFVSEGRGEVLYGKTTGVENEVVYIAAQPEAGYKFKEWKVLSGGAVIEDITAQNTKFTFGKEDTVIEAVFVERESKINITVEGKGTATATKAYGANTFQLKSYPDEGYKLKEWIVHFDDGDQTVTDKSFYITCGTESIDVTVRFEKAPAVSTTVTSETSVTTTTTTAVTAADTETKETDISIETVPASKSSTSTSTSKTSKTTTSKTTKSTASSKTSKTSASKTSVTKTTSDTVATTVTTDDLKYILYGDVDLNDKVDLADTTWLAKHLLSPASCPLGDEEKGTVERARRSADTNGDGIVDIRDLSKLIEYNLGKMLITDLDPRKR